MSTYINDECSNNSIECVNTVQCDESVQLVDSVQFVDLNHSDQMNNPITNLINDPTTNLINDSITDSMNDSITNSMNDPMTNSMNDPITNSMNDPITNSMNDPVTKLLYNLKNNESHVRNDVSKHASIKTSEHKNNKPYIKNIHKKGRKIVRHNVNIRNNNVHDVRVITFNLLSQNTLTKVYFPFVKEHYADFDYRVTKTKKLMERWMQANFIICLQEMDEQWQKILQEFFSQHRYNLESVTYKNGKMGVGIAYPHNHFDLLKRDEFVCGTYVNPICQALTLAVTSEVASQKEINNNNTILNKITSELNNENHVIDLNPIIEQLTDAASSENTLLTLLFNCKYKGRIVGKTLTISNYHMPCRFMSKYFIVSHIHAIKVRLQELSTLWSTQMSTHASTITLNENENNKTKMNIDQSNVISTVLAGDFNVSAKAPEYKFLVGEPYTNAEIDSQVSEFGESIDFIKNIRVIYDAIGIDINDGIKMKSIHKTLHGSEPPYTNVSLKAELTFVACIDYILKSDNINIRSCIVGLTVNDPHQTVYPNGLCPSDHVPLSASLYI